VLTRGQGRSKINRRTAGEAKGAVQMGKDTEKKDLELNEKDAADVKGGMKKVGSIKSPAMNKKGPERNIKQSGR
jgi:hypothetical protein